MAKHQGARMWKVVKTKVRHNLSHTFVLSHSALRPRGGQGKVSGLEPPTQVVHMLPGGVGSMTKQKCLTTKSSGGQSLSVTPAWWPGTPCPSANMKYATRTNSAY